ncbi:MAG: WYL domain-containing protein [Treponema sp.]|nr:WYL domain-containing protein [Treponema sp.]
MAEKRKDYEIVNARLESGEKLDRKFLNDLIIANQGIAKEWAHNFAQSNKLDSDEEDDLFITGLSSLKKAAETYNPKNEKGGKFSTWATLLVKRDIIHELKKIKKEKMERSSFSELSEDLTADNFADITENIEANFLSEEEREREKEQVAKLIRKNTKGIKEKELEGKINVFLEFSGLVDGTRKSVTELKQMTGRKRSRIITMIKSCQRILQDEYNVENSGDENRISENLKDQDLVLLKYIIEMNGDKAYPTAKDILASPVTSPYFSSRYTVYDSINRLKFLKNCKFEQIGQNHGYKILNPTEVTSLTDVDLMAASIINILMKEYSNTPYKKAFQAILEKIRGNISVIKAGSSLQKEPLTIKTDPLPEINPKVFQKIYEACRGQHTISFEYESVSSGDIGERKADPYHIVCQKGSWYLLAFCHKDQDFKWFSFSRFKSVKVLKTNFEVKDGFKLDQYFDEKAGILWSYEPIRGRILVHQNLATFMEEREWFSTQEIIHNEDGTLYLDFSTNNPQELYRYIMQWSPDIELIGPESVRKKIKEMLETSLSFY